MADLPHGGRESGADVPAAAVDRIVRQLGPGEVAPRRPDGAELEASGGEDVPPGADDQLGGPAADVAHDHLAVEHGHGLEHAEEDQPRLLEAGDDLDLDAHLPGPLDEG